ncbi:hypothetical protein BC937DRAFT_92084 [Endogone sp. FLAS-F59071]|nr:hypothetical protein BC937DRAFT_92084 [Endogone sp. FLAS-F59071]|eukprot:RUS15725.1 hypothetical protein BC937DRAFT_92084 [Endogone sp. FLAS-F59071]
MNRDSIAMVVNDVQLTLVNVASDTMGSLSVYYDIHMLCYSLKPQCHIRFTDDVGRNFQEDGYLSLQ